MKRYFCGLLLVALLGGCQKDNPPDGPVEYPPFIIENLGVEFGPWDSVTNYAGDFLFAQDFIKIFSEFAVEVKAFDGSFKKLPHFSYVVKVNTDVFAIAEGKVFSIFYQEDGNDYEIGIRSERNPNFEVFYDHLQNLQIDTGDLVQPGQNLGTPRSWGTTHAFLEIMINNTEDKYSYCPFVFFEPDKAVEYRDLVLQLINDWETFKGDTTLYDESTLIYAGCLQESILSY